MCPFPQKLPKPPMTTDISKSPNKILNYVQSRGLAN